MTDAAKVLRYDLKLAHCDLIKEDRSGRFVTHADYKALEENYVLVCKFADDKCEELAALRARVAHAAQPVEAVDERAAFEAHWIARYCTKWNAPVMDSLKRKGARYANGAVHEQWETWQAALAHPRPTGAVALMSVVPGGEPVLQTVEAWKQLSAGNHLLYAAPTGEQSGEVVTGEAVAEIIRGPDNDFRVSWLIEGGIDALIEGETLYILGMKCPEDGAVELYAQPRPVGVPDALTDPDNPWRRAVEHAGYLVTTINRYMEAKGEAAVAFEQVEGVEYPTDEAIAQLEAAHEAESELFGSVRNDAYEFAKRRDRALATLAAAPAPGKDDES